MKGLGHSLFVIADITKLYFHQRLRASTVKWWCIGTSLLQGDVNGVVSFLESRQPKATGGRITRSNESEDDESMEERMILTLLKVLCKRLCRLSRGLWIEELRIVVNPPGNAGNSTIGERRRFVSFTAF